MTVAYTTNWGMTDAPDPFILQDGGDAGPVRVPGDERGQQGLAAGDDMSGETVAHAGTEPHDRPIVPRAMQPARRTDDLADQPDLSFRP